VTSAKWAEGATENWFLSDAKIPGVEDMAFTKDCAESIPEGDLHINVVAVQGSMSSRKKTAVYQHHAREKALYSST
jgi:hypothetical protein